LLLALQCRKGETEKNEGYNEVFEGLENTITWRRKLVGKCEPKAKGDKGN